MALTPDNRRKWLTLLAAAAIGVLALDKVVLTPYVRAWKERAERLGELRQSITRGEALLDRADSMERRWDQMKAASLSPDPSLAENDVLQAVARWARDSRISFNSMTPQAKQPEPGYALLECRTGATGDLDAIIRFLYELEKDPLAVKVDELQLSAQDERGRELSMTMRFSGLQLLTENRSPTPRRSGGQR